MSKAKKNRKNKSTVKSTVISRRPISMVERYNMKLMVPSEPAEVETKIGFLQISAKKEADDIIQLYYRKNVPVEKVRKRTFGDLLKIYIERKKKVRLTKI